MEGVLPFPAMIAMECINVGLNTLFKAATAAGMSHHVFVVYSYSFAALLLLPSPFISRRSTRLPPLTFSLLSKIALLGFIGYTDRTFIIFFFFFWIFKINLVLRVEMIWILCYWQFFFADYGIHGNQLQLSNACFRHQQPCSCFHFHSCHHLQVPFLITKIPFFVIPSLSFSQGPFFFFKGLFVLITLFIFLIKKFLN